MKKYKYTVLIPALSLLLTGCGNDSSSQKTKQKSYSNNETYQSAMDKNSYALNGLEFYSDIDTAKALMSEFNLISETKETSGSGQIQTLIEYENTELFGEIFNLSLNFKNRKLIRFNYNMKYPAEESLQIYEKMIDKVTDVYGKCYSSDNSMTMWHNTPIGKNSFIYFFNQNDNIKISFDTQ